MKKITLLLLFISSIIYAQTPEGTWKLTPVAGSLAVGPTQGSSDWWSSSEADVTTRACLFDDEYVFESGGTFQNVLGTETWIEGWQGASPDGCAAPVAPHDNSNAATWSYNSGDGTITLTGTGAYLGLAKVTNSGELANPADAPNSITYTVTSITSSEMTLDINYGGGWWRFLFTKQETVTPEGTWKLTPAAGSLAVGPTQGSSDWWSNSGADVTTRACLFDDEYVFESGGTFQNILGTETWIEGWQGGSDACGSPVAPHDNSNAATWAYDSGDNTIILTGQGAYLGIPKVHNTGELSNPADAPGSITYTVSELTESSMVLDINYGGGWWRFTFTKEGATPTCSDGIQNGDETGIDCGGSCPPCLAQIDLPVDFEGSTTDYTVTDFGGNASSLVPNPDDGSDMVIQSIKTSGAATWAGTTIGTASGFATPIPFTATERKMIVRVWSPDAGIPVLLKVEDSSDGTKSVETLTNTTVANGWQLMEFDFDNEAPNTAAFNDTYTYNKASIFFNFGTDGATAGEKTYYFDDVMFGSIALSADTNKVLNVSLYPNPATDELHISSENVIENGGIYNLLGKKVKSFTINKSNASIDVSNLDTGIYILKYSVNNTTGVQKFVKQ